MTEVPKQIRQQQAAALRSSDLDKISTWTAARLRNLLGFDDVDEIVGYLASLPAAADVLDYAEKLLGKGPKTTSFVSEYLSKRRKEEQRIQQERQKREEEEKRLRDSIPADVQIYIKPKLEDEEGFRGKRRKQAKKKPAEAVQPAPEEPAAASASHTSKPAEPAVEPKKRRVVTQQPLPPGRVLCWCQATVHRLLTNCLTCGKILCEREGLGPCTFCGRRIRGQPRVSAEYYQQLSASEQAAVAFKDRLLEYDRAGAARTKVYDDQADYFNVNWLSAEERALLKKKEEQRKRDRAERRRRTRVTIDFAGRRVVEAVDDEDDHAADDSERRRREEASDAHRRVLPNPALEGPAPVWVPGGLAKPPHPTPPKKAVLVCAPARVQHQYFLDEQEVLAATMAPEEVAGVL